MKYKKKTTYDSPKITWDASYSPEETITMFRGKIKGAGTIWLNILRLHSENKISRIEISVVGKDSGYVRLINPKISSSGRAKLLAEEFYSAIQLAKSK
jgi:hypothetical protein